MTTMMAPPRVMVTHEESYRPTRQDFFPRGNSDNPSPIKKWCEDRGLNTKHPITTMMRNTGIPYFTQVD
jgi:hypothetical protein